MAIFRSKNEQSEKQHDAADTPALSSDGSRGNEKTGNTLHLENGLNGTGATAASGIEPEKERKLLRKIDLIVIPCESRNRDTQAAQMAELVFGHPLHQSSH